MDFNQRFNIPKDASHTQKYDTIINNLGYDDVKLLVPASRDRIIKALAEDEHLNNIPLATWDTASYDLKPLCVRKGVTVMAQAELVCILKRCAVRMAYEAKERK